MASSWYYMAGDLRPEWVETSINIYNLHKLRVCVDFKVFNKIYFTIFGVSAYLSIQGVCSTWGVHLVIIVNAMLYSLSAIH